MAHRGVVHGAREAKQIVSDGASLRGVLPDAGPIGLGSGSREYAGTMRTHAAIAVLLAVFASSLGAQQAPPTAAEQALLEAAFQGELDEVDRLVSAGVRVDAVDPDGRSPMMFAAFNGHTRVVSRLLVAGARVDLEDVNGRTALMYAASGPFAETVEVLLDAGAEVDVQGTLEGFTALMTAAAEGQFEVVRLLLERGADPAIEDVDGDTALSFARQNGHTEVVELLTKTERPG